MGVRKEGKLKVKNSYKKKKRTIPESDKGNG